MSLLMDALKKAEMAKRQQAAAGGQCTADSASIDVTVTAGTLLEPAAATEPAPNDAAADLEARLTEAALGLSLEDLQPGSAPISARTIAAGPAPEPATAAPAKTSSPPAPSAPSENDRRRTENLFQVKRATEAASAQASKKTFAIVVGACTLASLVAIGAYFWWQLQPKSGLGLNSSVPPTAAIPAPPAAVASAAPATTPMAPPNPIPAAAAVAPNVAPAPAAETDPVPVAAMSPARQKNASRYRPTAVPGDDDDERPVRVTRLPPRVNPQLTQAFDANNRGDWAAAQQAYQAVLSDDRHNADALHGLASLLQRQGKTTEAEPYLQRLVQDNPQDTTALSALGTLLARRNPAQAETRLRALADSQPEQPAPHIALGNLYAAQARWSDAQQAYFNAYALEPDNPDVLYNLAISLDNLAQARLARRYYEEALLAARRRPASFAPAQIEERLRALAP